MTYSQTKMLKWFLEDGWIFDRGGPLPSFAAMTYAEIEAWSKPYRPEAVECEEVDGRSLVYGWRDDIGELYEIESFETEAAMLAFCDEVLDMQMVEVAL